MGEFAGSDARPPRERGDGGVGDNGRVTTIVSIQSAVAYGHVGNSAAVFPLQRLGVEVWPVYTVTFSNHTGYGAWRGPLIPANDVREVILGMHERGALDGVDAVLSGYQGGTEIGAVILDAVARVKAANPSAIYACDPVMGPRRWPTRWPRLMRPAPWDPARCWSPASCVPIGRPA